MPFFGRIGSSKNIPKIMSRKFSNKNTFGQHAKTTNDLVQLS